MIRSEIHRPRGPRVRYLTQEHDRWPRTAIVAYLVWPPIGAAALIWLTNWLTGGVG